MLGATADKSADNSLTHTTLASPEEEWPAIRSSRSERRMERETGIEPATNSLEGCDSTTELLPPTRHSISLRRYGGQARFALTPTCPMSRRPLSNPPTVARSRLPCLTRLGLPSVARSLQHRRAKEGGEGRTRTFEAARATDLQSAAFDRFATSPAICC